MWRGSDTSVSAPKTRIGTGSSGSFCFTKSAIPRDLSSEHISQFLTHLAVNGQVAASTQNQALNALVFLYRQVLKIELPQITGIVRAPQKRRLPVVLTHEETDAVIARLEPRESFDCSLLYG